METLQPTVCPYCAVGCGALVRLVDGRPVGVEGDPQHPINRGALCAKGTLMLRALSSPNRVTKVRHRAAGAARWEEKPWDWAVARLAELIAKTRSKQLPNGRDRMMVLGGTTVDNEDGEAILTFARAIGAAHDCHARLSHASTYTALKATFGKPAMDFNPEDLERCRAIVVWGGNPADNHPVAMQWFLRAKDKGAKLVVVDPRVTRTAAVADLHLPLRCGADLAIIGAIIREAFERKRIDRTYLAEKTDAGFRIEADPLSQRPLYRFARDPSGRIERDPELSGECVLTTVRNNFWRYEAVTSAATAGLPIERFKQLGELLLAPGDRPTAIFVGQGIAQHERGTQSVRGLAILQMLLGHADKPGGGIYVLGSEANERGAIERGLLAPAPPRLDDVAGLLVFGENPAVGMPEMQTDRLLDRLDWCVVMDQWETETAAFWRRPGATPADIATEVFLLPMADALERDGRMTNACGTVQRRTALAAPAGDARSVASLLERLGAAVKAASPDAMPTPNEPARPSAAAPHRPPEKPDLFDGRSRLLAVDWVDQMLPVYAEPFFSPVKEDAFRDPSPHVPPWCKAALLKPMDERPPWNGATAVGFIVRIGEHSQQGLMTRTMPWLVEMVPSALVEISKTLAAALGVRNGQVVRVRGPAAEIRLPAIVTSRLRKLDCAATGVEQVAIVGQFGFCGLATGPTASLLVSGLADWKDPRSGTPAIKGFWCRIEKAE